MSRGARTSNVRLHHVHVHVVDEQRRERDADQCTSTSSSRTSRPSHTKQDELIGNVDEEKTHAMAEAMENGAREELGGGERARPRQRQCTSETGCVRRHVERKVRTTSTIALRAAVVRDVFHPNTCISMPSTITCRFNKERFRRPHSSSRCFPHDKAKILRMQQCRQPWP